MARRGPKRMKLEDPRVQRLLNALRLGHYVEDACEYAPISKPTYYRWLNEAEDIDQKAQRGETLTNEEEEIREIVNAIKVAEMAGQNVALDIIRNAMAGGTWQAAAWFLERRNKKWSNRTEVTGSNGGPVETVSVDELDAKLMGMIAAAKASEAERESHTGTHETKR